MTQLSHDSYVQKRDEIVPKCINPNCDNNGSVPEQASEDEWVQAQCEYCFTVRFPMLQAIDDLVQQQCSQARIDELERLVNQSKRLTHVDAHISQYGVAKDVLVHSCSLAKYRIAELQAQATATEGE